MSFKFMRKIENTKKLKRNLPRKVANVSKNFFLDNFRKQGFDDTNVSPWKKRKMTKKDKGKRRRALLVNKGHLRRSIRVGIASFNRIEVGSYGIKYARVHNRGEGRMPKRQFIGNSHKLNLKVKRIIKEEMRNVFK